MTINERARAAALYHMAKLLQQAADRLAQPQETARAVASYNAFVPT